MSLRDIEGLLVCLPGVQKARVVINDWGAIDEIHILTGLGRNPKQIVRDVQSALKAKWDISLDRRKISVAQIRVGLPKTLGRLKYVSLDLKSSGSTGKIELSVTLERGAEDELAAYIGRVQCDSNETSLLLGISRATCLAVNLALEPPHAFSVDDVTSFQIGSSRAVAILLDLVTPRRNREQMVGCAVVRRDVKEACVRATLDGVNRRMELIPARGTVVESEPQDTDTGSHN